MEVPDKRTAKASKIIHKSYKTLVLGQNNISTKYIMQRSNGNIYFQLRVGKKIHQFSLKTKNIIEAMYRRDNILKCLNGGDVLENDRITLEIINKIMGLKMFEFIGDYPVEEMTDEKIKRKIEILRQKRLNSEMLKLEEVQRLAELNKIPELHLLSIQNDIKLKFDNSELSLNEEQIRERERKKIEEAEKLLVSTQPAQIEYEPKASNINLPYKEYWDKYLEIKEKKSIANKQPLSKDSKDKLGVAYKYLLDFLDGNENYNICDLTPLFFKELQIKYTQIPSRATMYSEFKDKSIRDIIEMDFDKEKFPLIITTTVNNLFAYYIEFFKYLESELFVYKNDIFKNYEPLKKHEAESYKEFTIDELNLLLHNNLPYTYEGKDIKKEILVALRLFLYTGFRLNELAQIKKTDIIEKDGVLCFDLTSDKQLKNVQSIRVVPIHSKILELVKLLIRDNKSEYLIYNGDSKEIGKKLLRYIKVHIHEKGKVVHSFRSNLMGELYANDVEERHIKKLLGHTSDKRNTSNHYYNKNKSTIVQLVSALESVKYEGLVS